MGDRLFLYKHGSKLRWRVPYFISPKLNATIKKDLIREFKTIYDDEKYKKMKIDLEQIQIQSNKKINHMSVNMSYDLEKTIDLINFENYVRQYSEIVRSLSVEDKELNFKTLDWFLTCFKDLEVIQFNNAHWSNFNEMTGIFSTVKEIIINHCCICNPELIENHIHFWRLWFPKLVIVRLNNTINGHEIKENMEKYELFVTHIKECILDKDTDYMFIREHLAKIKFEKLIIFHNSIHSENIMEILKSHTEISELEYQGHIKDEDFEWICKNLKNLKVLDINRMKMDVNNYHHIINLENLIHLDLSYDQINEKCMESLNTFFPNLGFRYFQYHARFSQNKVSKIVEKPPHIILSDNIIPEYDDIVDKPYTYIKKLCEEKNMTIEVHAKDFLIKKHDNMNYLKINMTTNNIVLMDLVLIKERIKRCNGTIKYLHFTGNKLNFKSVKILLFLLFEEVEVLIFDNDIWCEFKELDTKFSKIKQIIIESVPKFEIAEDIMQNWKLWFPNVTKVILNRFSDYAEMDELKFIKSFITHINTLSLTIEKDLNYNILVKNSVTNCIIDRLETDVVYNDVTAYESFIENTKEIMKTHQEISEIWYYGDIKTEDYNWLCTNLRNLTQLWLLHVADSTIETSVHILNFTFNYDTKNKDNVRMGIKRQYTYREKFYERNCGTTESTPCKSLEPGPSSTN